MAGPVAAEPAAARFGLLGPLQVVDGTGAARAVPAAKQRIALAALLLSSGSMVSAAGLAEALWDASPPPNAPAVMRTYVARLRRALGPVGTRIVGQPSGWAVRFHGPEEFDLAEVDALWRTAQGAAGAREWEQASSLLARALSLWRGEPLADVPSAALARREAGRLAELRLQLTEARTDADLCLGRHGELVAGLRRLAAEHPLREHIQVQLMLACYRCGHQGAALEVYRDARRTLAEELGVEPGPELREMHQKILAADPGLTAAGPARLRIGQSGGGSPRQLHQRMLSADPALAVTEPARPMEDEPQRRVTPRELPPAVPGFTGRSAALRALTRLLGRPDEHARRAVVISVIAGTAGVGKTALAVHWAHQATGHFPDGQLYVNLRGYDPGQPMPAADALAGFLRSLGMPGQDVPPEAEERTARYRSLLAGKRVLIVLDNAVSAEQVRPLLPGTSACTVVVTSRDALAGLVARDGAARLDLDVFPLEEAVALLRTLIGARVDAEPGAAAELADQCCRLPLALRVAAELAASRPAMPLAGLAGELANHRTRLDLLAAGGDRHTEVRTVLSWSCRDLDADAARTFRLLGLHPGPSIEPYATAALTGATVPRASQALAVLARSHLILPAKPGRYDMHDLLRGYARELTATLDTEAEKHAARTRLFDHYLHTAAVAMDTLFPGERHRRPRIPPPPTPAPPVTDSAAALAWLDAERATLVAVTVHTASHGWPAHATRLAATLFRYLDSGGHYPEAITIHSQACLAARRTGDPAAEAEALTSLGVLDLRQGYRPQAAAAHLQQGLALFRQAGDRSGEVRALGNLGILSLQLGRYEQASGYLQQALALFRETGDQAGEARALATLSTIDFQQGRYEKATGHIHRTLALFREAGDRTGEAHALSSLGEVDLRQGNCRQAAGHLGQALALFREIGSRSGEARALTGLGDAALRKGRYEQAADYHRHSLAVCREIGYQSGEVTALNGLGAVFLATGRSSDARAQYAAALSMTTQSGEKYEQAHAHNGLAHAYHAAGDPGQARRHWNEALILYTSLRAPETDQVRARLATTGDHALP
jgi:DNA-binding SARP family transcriptional activator/tetratricopeptide (TPR) repeat protein